MENYDEEEADDDDDDDWSNYNEDKLKIEKNQTIRTRKSMGLFSRPGAGKTVEQSEIDLRCFRRLVW